jgi:hypothetical protein
MSQRRHVALIVESSCGTPPKGVVTRQSTDVLAIEDREVAQAIR